MSKNDLATMLRDYRELKDMRRELDEALEALEDQIKAVMGNQETISAGGIEAHWSRYTTKRFDTRAFKAENGHLYDLYVKEVPAQRFQVA